MTVDGWNRTAKEGGGGVESTTDSWEERTWRPGWGRGTGRPRDTPHPHSLEVGVPGRGPWSQAKDESQPCGLPLVLHPWRGTSHPVFHGSRGSKALSLSGETPPARVWSLPLTGGWGDAGRGKGHPLNPPDSPPAQSCLIRAAGGRSDSRTTELQPGLELRSVRLILPQPQPAPAPVITRQMGPGVRWVGQGREKHRRIGCLEPSCQDTQHSCWGGKGVCWAP